MALLLLAGAFAARAEAVSETRAREIAGNYMGVKSPQLAFRSSGGVKTASAESDFYAYNNPSGGWVIVSGDDCAIPILAHAESGSLSQEDLPPNLRNWLAKAAADIAAASAAGIEPSETVKKAWASNGLRLQGQEVVLQTAAWNQGSVYNATVKSKLGTSKNVYAGCVAAAMSIVLRHMKHPATGTGVIEGYTSYDSSTKEQYTVPETDISSYVYDWDNMPLTDAKAAANGWTDEQKSAVADLMFHCGAMVQMTYSSKGSGAYSSDIIPALVKHMGCSANARALARGNYSNYEWLRMLKAEIDADRPLLYSGSDVIDDNGGHQFVLDGYNSDNEVHVNWGWGGSGNDWFAINYLGDEDNIGYAFSDGDAGIFDLVPADTEYDMNAELMLMDYVNYGYKGLAVASGTIAKDSDFSLNMMLVNKSGVADYYGKVKPALFSMEGEVKQTIGNAKNVSVSASTTTIPYVHPTLSCRITTDIAPGDYVGLLCTKSDGSWTPVGAYPFSYYAVGKLSATGISYIYVPSELTAGQRFYFDYIGGSDLPVSFEWTFDGEPLPDEGNVVLTAGTHTVKVVVDYYDGSGETLVRQINVQ